MKVVSLLLAVLALAGCTRVLDISGSDWQRDRTSIQQETLDEMECARNSEFRGVSWTVVGGLIDAVRLPIEDATRGARYDSCMERKGYARVTSSAN
jgi:hypothetical protein